MFLFEQFSSIASDTQLDKYVLMTLNAGHIANMYMMHIMLYNTSATFSFTVNIVMKLYSSWSCNGTDIIDIS